MKLKLKGRRFDTIEEIQAESRRVLDTVTEKTSRKHLKMEQSLVPVSTCEREILRE
jgi:predicted P-loop ATPase/GTPase